MSRRELERASILERVKSAAMRLATAASLLGLSYRQTRRLHARYKAYGAAGLVHASAGRPSNRSHPRAEREMVISLIRQHYGGEKGKGPNERFGPTLVAEHLWIDHGVLVPVRTLTRWMTGDGIWSRARKTRSVKHPRRERKAEFGALVQLDGSFHDWFEGRGGIASPCLMTMVDDATGVTLLSFEGQETTWSATRVLRSWISAYGIPRALYTDWKNVYKRPLTAGEKARGESEAFTQFGRMCEKLGITIIPASSPQAKGRVERAHGTHQDRLIKKLRLKEISDLEAANEFLRSDYIPAHNRRFSVRAVSEVDSHRPRNSVMISDEDIYCLEYSRMVGHDHVVQYETKSLQLDPRLRGRVPAKSKVLVRESEDGTLRVIKVEREGRHTSERALKWTSAPPRLAKPSSLPPDIEVIETKLIEVEKSARKSERPKPAADHPWRVQHSQWAELARRSRAAQMQTPELND
jgi:hypothetical protein